jgi:DNA-binding MarR family transcriptional regulator
VLTNALESVGAVDSLTATDVLGLQWLSRKRAGVSELARLLGMHENGASVLVNRLSERGFVRRRRGPNDRRSVTISLTETGKTLAASHAVELKQQYGRAFVPLDPSERTNLTSSLDSVSQFRYDSGRAVYACFKDDVRDNPASVGSRAKESCQDCHFVLACSISDDHQGRRPYIDRQAFEAAANQISAAQKE